MDEKKAKDAPLDPPEPWHPAAIPIDLGLSAGEAPPDTPPEEEPEQHKAPPHRQTGHKR
jgi:hypothetical protein